MLIRLNILVAAVLATAACRAAPPTPTVALPFPTDTVRASPIRDGVVHRFIYSSAGPWAIHVLEARTDRCWTIAALKSSGGAIGRAPTSELVRAAAQHETIAGGVNADFFRFTPPGVPVGLLAVNGRVITGPVEQAALAADSSGAVRIARFETVGSVTIGEHRLEIDAWNNVAPRGLAWFDGAWGTLTDTATGVMELALEGRPDYRVSLLDTTSAGVPIPSSGGVLVAGRQAHDSVRSALVTRVGSEVRAQLALAPFHPREAVGGRPALVIDGAIAARLDTVGRTGFSTSRHPRTAAGITRDGRLLLVTVDGRQAPYSDGMTLQELAELMRALGAWDALNLDGGGSTAMVVASDTGYTVVNRPSDRGGERAVGDAVGLMHRCR